MKCGEGKKGWKKQEKTKLKRERCKSKGDLIRKSKVRGIIHSFLLPQQIVQSIFIFLKETGNLGAVVQKSLNANPELQVNSAEDLYFSGFRRTFQAVYSFH